METVTIITWSAAVEKYPALQQLRGQIIRERQDHLVTKGKKRSDTWRWEMEFKVALGTIVPLYTPEYDAAYRELKACWFYGKRA